jgi:flagellar FliL protein
MAENDIKETSEAVVEESAPAPAGRGRLPLIALAAVGLAVGGGTGALFIGPMLAKKMSAKAASHTEADSAATDSSAHGKPGEAGVGSPTVQLLENLVLNPAGSGGSRFLLLSIAIECADAKVLGNMQVRDAELRDVILTSLGSKTVEELTDVSARERIKKEIQASIEERFGKASVSRIYFPQFVIQ